MKTQLTYREVIQPVKEVILHLSPDEYLNIVTALSAATTNRTRFERMFEFYAKKGVPDLLGELNDDVFLNSSALNIVSARNLRGTA